MQQEISLSQLRLESLTSKQKEDVIEWAELGCYVFNQEVLFNPMDEIPVEFDDEPELYLAGILSRPEYFFGICQELFGVTLTPMQCAILENMWQHKRPMLIGCRGMSKTFMLAIYTLLRMYLLKGRKIVICASGFRQAKLVIGYIEEIRSKSVFLKNAIRDDDIRHGNEMWEIKLGSSSVKAIPMGTSGSTIRGLRANDVLAEEFASIPLDIYEEVVTGFAAVSSSPYEKARLRARKKWAENMNLIKIVADEENSGVDNQTIICGTAYYTWNHFYKYHERYRKIIKSRGDRQKLEEIFNGEVPKAFNWKDYSIIRIPFELLPEDFMDESTIASTRATIDSATYANEYGAIFSNDSTGFFKRSIIDSCIPQPELDLVLSNGHILDAKEAFFIAALYGRPDRKYVFGVDPAIKDDNFSISIIELNKNHRKLVYVWTINGAIHKDKLKYGLIKENNYYAYCARKIRDLMNRFPCVALALDPQGGGEAVREALTDKDKILPHERLVLPVIDSEKPKDTDSIVGDHIIHLCSTSSSTWISDANHDLKKDLEDRIVLFPFLDAIALAEAEFMDEARNNDKKVSDEDSLAVCIYEIEELKDELSSIIVTETQTGKQHFDTPETVAKSGKKGKMKKDRYSSLLMANKIARDFFPFDSHLMGERFDIHNTGKSTTYIGNQDLVSKFNHLHAHI
jgi:hypothetical protein